MKCVRCGSEIKETDRNCLKCGAMNYSNPLNKEYAIKYADEKELQKSNPHLLEKRLKKSTIILIIVILISIIIGIILKALIF